VADSQANHGPPQLGAGEIQCGFQDSIMEVALVDSIVPTEPDRDAVAANHHGHCCIDSAALYPSPPFSAGRIGSYRSFIRSSRHYHRYRSPTSLARRRPLPLPATIPSNRAAACGHGRAVCPLGPSHLPTRSGSACRLPCGCATSDGKGASVFPRRLARAR
jgi:hypothetical protein